MDKAKGTINNRAIEYFLYAPFFDLFSFILLFLVFFLLSDFFFLFDIALLIFFPQQEAQGETTKKLSSIG